MKLQLAILNRRGVFKTLAGYAVVSWILIEVTSVIGPAFLLPDWTVAAVTTALVLGCLPVLLLSWRYEFSLDGIKRDTRVVPDEFDFSAKSLLTMIIVLLLAITTSLWVNYYRSQSASEVEKLVEAQQGAPEIAVDGQIRSIAVLPFDDYSPGGGQSLLAEGISEAILRVLAQNNELLVTSRKSSFMFRDKDVSAAEIGRILNVQVLLEGSIQIIGDHLRVSTQLVGTADQAHLWSNVYEAPLDDLFKINDEIAYEVRELILPATQASSNMAEQAHPPSVEAFNLLLEARELIGEPEPTEMAIRLLGVIVDTWPDYSDAWAWTAVAYETHWRNLRDSHVVSDSEIADAMNQVIVAQDNALEIDPHNHLATLLRGRSSLGSGSANLYTAVDKVLNLAPNDPRVLEWLADLYYGAANFEMAAEHIARARAVEPADHDILWKYFFYNCGRITQIPIVETQLEDYPQPRENALYLRLIAQYCDRQYVEAISSLTRLARLDKDPETVFYVLMWLAALGHQDALALVDDVHRVMPEKFNEAMIDGEFNPLYFRENLDQRRDTYRRHINIRSLANRGTHLAHAVAMILAGDYKHAEVPVDMIRQNLEQDYAGGTESLSWQSNTLTTYAFKAWLLAQRGAVVEASELTEEVLRVLGEKNIDQWSGSRGLIADIPLMILLQGGRVKPAVNWLLDAERDQWLHFQPLLTSPVYDEFREIPVVAEALARMVAWRAGVLDELMSAGLPEVQDPSLLLDMLASTVTRSHHQAAQMALHFDDDPVTALQHYQWALEDDPDNPVIFRQLASLATEYGFVDEAILLNERAAHLSPLEPGVHSALSSSYADAGRWDEAVTTARKVIELDPEDARYQRWWAQTLILADRPQEAYEACMEISDDWYRGEWQRNMCLVISHYALGEQAESDAILSGWVDSSRVVQSYHVAYALTFRGDIDAAFEWLDKAATVGAYNANIAVFPFLSNLHDDPRWLPFLESIGKSPQQLEGIEFNLVLPD